MKTHQDITTIDTIIFSRIALVEDYGEQLAQYLVQWVDIWLNNPLPPFEACRTSGMEAALKRAASSFSARRMVKQYIEKFYSRSGKHALENKGAGNKQLHWRIIMNEKQQPIDPVCGKSIYPDECQFRSDDEKGVHYFCSEDCQNKFDKADAKTKKGFWARYTERLKDVQCSRTSQDCK